MERHPTAIIHDGAQIETGVYIGPYVVIASPNVVLKKGVVLKAHVYIEGDTVIGEKTTVWPFASIGTQTQDLKYQGERTFVRIGQRCQIREYVTINASCKEDTEVRVGDDCLIMAYCHIAHNCRVGNRVIMSNGATLAGHVTVDDFAVLGGLCAVHQFVRIGKHAMVGGGSMLARDLPPFTTGSGYPLCARGLNITGLKRNGFSLKERQALTQAYKLTFDAGLNLERAIEKIRQQQEDTGHVNEWINFCRASTRGLVSSKKGSEL